MNNSSNIQNEVLATMNSLNGLEPASPGPFFYTRLQSRLAVAEKNIWEKMSAFIARPVIATAMVAFIVLINTFAVIEHKNATNLPSDQTDQSVYEEFNVAVNTFYDYEIKEP